MSLMRRVLSWPAAGFCAFVIATTAPAQASDASQKEWNSFHWQHGSLGLSDSHGTFVVPRGARMVVGNDAHRADELLNGETTSDSEAMLEEPGYTLYLSYDDSGHVTADDWNDVNADQMLDDIKKATEDDNAGRKAAGVEQFHVDHWVQPPVYDPKNKSVRWIFALRRDSGTTFVNATALSLGRSGYEKFILVSDGKNPAADRAALAGFTRDYTFDKGFRFSDFTSGDKLAGYGLAALVGSGVGVTLAKTGALAAILIFAKKFFIIIVALAIGLFTRIRKMFGGNKMQVGPPAAPPPAPPAPTA